ncbi:hypothetical protein [Limnofasciculus baicalensis]|uniref:Uncharacterized protein n=1 Tax=Limnofasciculus baicalensis BBK-W-15 TaxID=2699891 RepID=A0AAE3KR17_9CYAN|nr:hypothetical protein [Limnofasciculus baicalensis]MCP2727952.1 hypothetical protein [Limnofasciculus baicalensis BBK-W-15]
MAIAIYDIVMFFTNRSSQVIELAQAVTGAVGALASPNPGIAKGAVGNLKVRRRK